MIDPGVGTKRKSVVAKTKTGHYIVTPDNGTLTLIADTHGIIAMREIDKSINRRPGTEQIHTFHGRDVYAYTGARLAAGVIDFEGVGPKINTEPQMLSYQKPSVSENGDVLGQLVNLERPFGNMVTNIPKSLFTKLGLDDADNVPMNIQIKNGDKIVFDKVLPYSNSFRFVKIDEAVLYSDSQESIGLAVRNGNFSKKYGVGAGEGWEITLSRAQ